MWAGKHTDSLSKVSLQQLGIIERTPEPIPLEDRDPESLTPAEVKEVMARLKVCRAAPLEMRRVIAET